MGPYVVSVEISLAQLDIAMRTFPLASFEYLVPLLAGEEALWVNWLCLSLDHNSIH